MSAATLQGIVPNLDEAEYHAHPALSSTGARRILDSPARFRWMQDHPEPPRREFDVGTAVHGKVLGTGAPVTVIPPEYLASNGAVSTREAKAFVEAARLAGKVPVKQAVADEVNDMAEAVLAHPTARQLFEQDGHAELSMFATDPATGVEIRCRFDWWAKYAVDLKTTAGKASKSGFERAAADHGYDVQQEHYGDVAELIFGERHPFLFVVVEKAAPYLVGVHQLDREFVEIGRKKAAKARRVFAECAESGIWPGYPAEVQLLSPPLYHVYDFQENHE